ncbi:MAG: formamidopyrimidine-DNA glycosylase [Rhodothermales bacterium]|nr:formamidopyrimidine-DNA glycosylase [Rhodothermales bacterium]
MPELPDIEAYLHVLRRDLVGREVNGVRLKSPFLVRTIAPPLKSIEGHAVSGVRRIGKRVVLEFGGFVPERFVVIHLMKAGRLKWRKPGAGLPGKMGLCAFDFEHGTVIFTEAGRKRRASIHVVEGEEALAHLDPGGVEVEDLDADGFHELVSSHRHTMKRTLTDPHILSGIGSAYADEILLRAGLSPMKRASQLDRDESGRLRDACLSVLGEWTKRIQTETGAGWPEVTAFRPAMAAHGKAGEPCPQCGSPIQKIVYAETETNYCATCQTGGTVLKDRSLSRLLKEDWPRDLDAWQERLGRGSGGA